MLSFFPLKQAFLGGAVKYMFTSALSWFISSFGFLLSLQVRVNKSAEFIRVVSRFYCIPPFLLEVFYIQVLQSGMRLVQKLTFHSRKSLSKEHCEREYWILGLSLPLTDELWGLGELTFSHPVQSSEPTFMGEGISLVPRPLFSFKIL